VGQGRGRRGLSISYGGFGMGGVEGEAGGRGEGLVEDGGRGNWGVTRWGSGGEEMNKGKRNECRRDRFGEG